MFEEMETAAAKVAVTQAILSTETGGTVRIAAGEWVSRIIASNAAEIAGLVPDVQLEIDVAQSLVSLSRRESDIAIRNKRPEGGSMSIRRFTRLTYAIYASKAFRRDHPEANAPAAWPDVPWIGFDDAQSDNSIGRWILSRLNGRVPSFRISSSREMLEAAASGHGLAVLPRLIADADLRLALIHVPEERLSIDYWMLVHRELHDLPRIRATLKALTRVGRRISD